MHLRTSLHLATTAILAAAALALPQPSRAAAPDNNVEWNGISHVGWQDRRPLVPTSGESFVVQFQAYQNDLTAARVRIDDGAVQWVNAAVVETRGPYHVWAAMVPATASTSLQYAVEVTDGSDTDYYGPSGMSETLPAPGFALDFATLAHAPLGATPATTGTVFKVWSPSRASAHVAGAFNNWSTVASPLTRVGEYFIGRVAGAVVGQEYKFVFPGSHWNTDACARRLGSLPNLNAAIENPFAYVWQAGGYQTPQLEEIVIYQLHVGTFSGLNDPFNSPPFPARFIDVQNRVAHLVDLGVNAVMLNPITEFPGDNSAGYNPQTQWAPESRYGSPTALKSMIDALHAAGIAVLVDVVWNHFTVNDNFMWNYDGTQIYFDSPAAQTPWGSQADFDAQGVREYFLHSGMYWLEEMRVDGFRFDGTDYIGVFPQEGAGRTLMQEFNDIVDNRWADKIVIAEQLPNDPWITTPTPGGGGFDAQYFDAFTDRLREEVLDAAFGDPEMWKIRNIINGGGAWLNGRNVVNYLELHDEAWPTSGGQRFVKNIDTTAPHDDVWARGRVKLAQGLVLTAPGVPALLQGSEWLEDNDFGTDRANRIDWGHKITYANIYAYFKALIALRTGNPALCADAPHVTHHLNESGNVVGFYRHDGGSNRLVVLANFSNTDYTNYRVGVPIPGEWAEILNSQALEYGGSGLVNPNTLAADAIFADGFGQSVTITLPKMGFVILKDGPHPTSTGGDEIAGAPLLEGVFPSPASGRATFAYRIPHAARVRLTVHDVRGRLMATVIDAKIERGRHVAHWNGLTAGGAPAPAGVYLARFETGGAVSQHKLTLVR